MRKSRQKLLPVIDITALLFVQLSAWLLKIVRNIGVQHLPHCKNALVKAGIFPIRDHYYEPQFSNWNPDIDPSKDRNLIGIDWNIPEQLELLKSFTFSNELHNTPQHKPELLEFFLLNNTFESGDAEYWYQIIRTLKPRRIIEVGSGYSTLMAIKAIEQNKVDNQNYICEHICIEPYENTWLEQTNVSVVRKKVEDVELSFFSQLQENDILFIDSSHVIRPHGDVLFEYLELLPSLGKGVIVHIHDIFSPKNYLKQWLYDEVRLWNEQYLLEAFLTHNKNWKIIGALNYLHHNHYLELKRVAPFLEYEREPGSFYIQRIA